MEIYLIRHGQATSNVLRKCNEVPTKTVHLTKLGKEQAKIAAEKLKNKDIEVIFISELWRTRQTAEIINKHHEVKIIEDKLINERKTGFNGRHYEDFLDYIAKDPFFMKPAGGESFQEEKRRTGLFLNKLKKMKYNSIAIVSHEEPLKTMIGHIKKLSDKKIWNLKIENGQVIKFNL